MFILNAHFSKLIIGTSISALAVNAYAQENNQAADKILVIDEIIVTAQKRTQSIQDIPIAASAVTNEMIREQGLADPQDLSRITPSVDIWSSFGESQPKITIRGIGSANFEQFTDSAAIVYFDEFPLNPTPAKLPQFFDLERVEILRGPQGTLYGRNTTAGAINLISRRPSGETGGYITGTAGKYGQYDLEGAFETALTDELAIRTSARLQTRKGYGENLATGDDVYDKNSLAGRVGIEYKGNNGLSAYIKIWGQRSRADGYYTKTIPTEFDDGDPTTASADVPAHLVTGAVPNTDPFKEFWNNQKNDVNNWGVNANIDYDMKGHTLSFILGYLESDQDQDYDCDGSEFLVCQVDFIMDAQEFFSEVRLTSDNDGPFNYIVGMNYFNEDASLRNNMNSLLLPFLFGPGVSDVSFTADQVTESYAMYVDGTYRITSSLELLGGIRWTHDTKEFARQDFAAPTSIPEAIFVDFSNRQTWKELTYRFGLNWEVSDDANIYGTFSHGYRSGSFPTGFLASSTAAVNPEFVNNYELGVKSFLFDRRLRLNVSMFFMQFNDQQLLATAPGGVIPTLTNAGRSEIFGLEAEGQAIISDNLTVLFGISLLGTEYKEFFRGDRDLSGESLASAPDYKITLSPEYTVPLWHGQGFITGNFTFSGKQRTSNDFDLLERDIQEAYLRIDARFGWRGDSLDVIFWSKNLTNKLVLRDWLDLSAFGFQQYVYDEPVSYGVTINKRF